MHCHPQSRDQLGVVTVSFNSSPTSITNLLRLGFLNIIDGTIKGFDYESFKSHPYVQSRIALFNSFGAPFKVEIDKKAVRLNDYGKSFAKVCLGKEV